MIGSIISFLLTVDIIAIPLGILAGIIFAIQASKAQDIVAKKHAKRWMRWAFLGPIGVLVLLIVVNGFVDLLANTFK